MRKVEVLVTLVALNGVFQTPRTVFKGFDVVYGTFGKGPRDGREDQNHQDQRELVAYFEVEVIAYNVPEN